MSKQPNNVATHQNSKEDNYFRNKLVDQINVTDLITVHYFKYARDFGVAGEAHNFYEMVFIDSGIVTLTDGQQQHELKQGQAFFHAPSVFHNIRTNGDYANIIIFTFECCGIDQNALCGIVYNMSSLDKQLIFSVLSESETAFLEPLNIIEQTKMTARSDQKFGTMQIIKNNIEKLIISCIRKNQAAASKNEEATDSKRKLVKMIADYLALHLDKNLTLADIAKALGYSEIYLKKSFAAIKGCGIIRYHLVLKLEQAKKLIAEGHSFSETAEALCFASPQYFSRLFKQYNNMSPSDYKKSVLLTKLL